MRSMVEHVHQLWKEERVAIAIDFTMGNGNDTLSLAKIAKHVYSFDIQKEALMKTREQLAILNIKNVHLLQVNHLYFDQYVCCFDIGIFNLGYLPKGDQTITTRQETTMQTVGKALGALRKKGYLYIVVYIGHNEGKKESDSILSYVRQLDSHQYNVASFVMLNKQNAPYVIEIEKI